MSLGKVKRDILEELWKESAPLRPTYLSKRLNSKFQLVMIHIVELEKMGYVESPQKGYYKITQLGREALGFSPLTRELDYLASVWPNALECIPAEYGVNLV